LRTSAMTAATEESSLGRRCGERSATVTTDPNRATRLRIASKVDPTKAVVAAS
jgi:hypothetical protein